jgi:hypothetical protein
VYLSDGNKFTFGSVPVYTLTYNANAKNDWVAYGVEDCEKINYNDKLIYVTDGKTVQYVINVTKSTTGVPAAIIADVLKLYDAINDEQIANSLTKVQTLTKALNDATTAAAAQTVLDDITTAIGATDSKAEEKALNALKTAAEAKILTLTKDAAITKMKADIVAAIKAADTTSLVSDYDATVKDDATDITATSWGAGYETVKKTIDVWAGQIESKTTTTDVTNHLTAVSGNYNTLATTYVNALKTAADDKAAVDAAIAAITSSIEVDVTDFNTDTIKTAVESAVKKLINNNDIEITVTLPDYQVTGVGQKTLSNVTIKLDKNDATGSKTGVSVKASIVSDDQ